MLMIDPDPEALTVLRQVADRLGCEYVEAATAAGVQEVLGIRRPTIAVFAVDGLDANGMAALDALIHAESGPAMLLIGNLDTRVLAGVKRAAKARNLPIIGLATLPLDPVAVERLLADHIGAAPPVAREEIERAILEHELTLLYQPKLSLASDTPIIQGVEALVRWQHPRRGLLQPRHFLHAIEAHGLMLPLTDFVLTEAVRQASVWRLLDLDLEITINMSTELVRDGAFPERLAILLEENDFPPAKLMLDVTQSRTASDRNLLLDVFTRLRLLGVGLSLDNFGTGLSSLTEIYRMPFSEIKVDHTLIADAPREREARIVVQAIVNLAHTLQIAVCAEGVETADMLEFVRSAKFDTAQGRFFSEPVQAAAIEHIVKAWPTSGYPGTGSWPVKAGDFDAGTTTIRALAAGSAQVKSIS